MSAFDPNIDSDTFEEELGAFEEVEVLEGVDETIDLEDDVDMDEEDQQVQDDEEEEVRAFPTVDNSIFAFKNHTDAVYCASVHPHDNSTFISG